MFSLFPLATSLFGFIVFLFGGLIPPSHDDAPPLLSRKFERSLLQTWKAGIEGRVYRYQKYLGAADNNQVYALQRLYYQRPIVHLAKNFCHQSLYH